MVNQDVIDKFFVKHELGWVDHMVMMEHYPDTRAYKAFKLPDIERISRQHYEEKELRIPCSTKYENNQDCIDDHMKTVMAAGTDRNIMVYNSNKEGLNNRIVGLMKTVSERNSLDRKPITHLLVDTHHNHIETDTDVEVVFCDLRRYTDFYENEMGGSFPAGRSELIIGLHTNLDSFHSIESKIGSGMAVLYSSTVLLGAI